MSRFAFAMASWGFFVVAAIPADPPEAPTIPKESYRRAVAADIAHLQKTLAEIAAAPDKPQAGKKAASKGVAVMLVRYADALGDDALKSHAVKIARSLGVGDWKIATQAGKDLKAPKADKAVLKAPLPKLTHADVFAPFRASANGGLNIDRDMKDQTSTATRIEDMDVKLAELVGTRTTALIEIAEGVPPTPETLDRLKRWDKYIRDTKRAAQDVATEAAKGEKADRRRLKELLRTLDARCSDCHPKDGRSDP